MWEMMWGGGKITFWETINTLILIPSENLLLNLVLLLIEHEAHRSCLVGVRTDVFSVSQQQFD